MRKSPSLAAVQRRQRSAPMSVDSIFHARRSTEFSSSSCGVWPAVQAVNRRFRRPHEQGTGLAPSLATPRAPDRRETPLEKATARRRKTRCAKNLFLCGCAAMFECAFRRAGRLGALLLQSPQHPKGAPRLRPSGLPSVGREPNDKAICLAPLPRRWATGDFKP